MNARRNFKYPIFIAAGIVAAGAIFYMVNSRIDSRQTQGAIGNRAVYRDTEVKAGDVNAVPGNAPVAIQALMEGKEFKALQKNAAFQELMANSSFQELAQNVNFLSLMKSEAFLQLTQNNLFTAYLRQPAMAEMANWLKSRSASEMNQAELMRKLDASLEAAHAQGLARNQMFQGLWSNPAFLALAKSDLAVQALSNQMMMNSFASLAQNMNFQALLSQQSFQNALMQGSAASLMNGVQRK